MAIIVFVSTVILMMISLVFYPKITIKNKTFDSHWIIVLLGAIFLLLFGNINFQSLLDSVFMDNAMNPIKLITFFISMTMLSIYLDEIGFFKKVALYILGKVKSSQYKIFTIFSLLVGILTIFVSNDVVILTLLPIMIFFTKKAKINPLPYVFSLLVFANSFSMVLIIGNPTNIYLGLNQGVGFLDYLKVMFIPGVLVGVVSFSLLFLIFRKELSKPLDAPEIESIYISKGEMIIGMSHMILTLTLLILSNVIDIEMWLITFVASISLILIAIIYYKKNGQKIIKIKDTVSKAPWSFIPLILGMYVLVEGIKQADFHLHLLELLNHFNTTFGYGISSFILANAMNNLPMSMFYALIIEQASPLIQLKATYATIIGANLGVLFTPFGALAGLMWFNLVKRSGIKLTITQYIKTLIIVGIVSLVTCLLVLEILL